MESLALYLPVLFVGMWCAMSYGLAYFGGWSRLADLYGDDGSHPGTTYYFRSGAVGKVRYKSCLILKVGDEGIRLSVIFPFRLGHPPLFIPWSEFYDVTEVTLMPFLRFAKADVGLPRIAQVQLPIWLMDRLSAT